MGVSSRGRWGSGTPGFSYMVLIKWSRGLIVLFFSLVFSIAPSWKFFADAFVHRQNYSNF